MSIEAMKQALEALKLIDEAMPFPVAKHAMSTLRQAIEQAEKQEPEGYTKQLIEALYENGDPVSVEAAELMEKLYTTPQPQEFVCSTGLCHFTLTQTNVGIGERGMQAYEAAKKRGWVGVSDERLMEMPKQEPVAWGVNWGKAGEVPCVSIIKRLPEGGIEVLAVEYGPPREWVGLTDEEMQQACYETFSYDPYVIAQAIEAKLKEKNT